MDRFDAQRFESLAKCRIRYGATPIYVTEGMHLFWSVDYSLRQMFDPGKPDDVFAFYVWWWLHLRVLYPHVPFPYGAEQRAFLHAPVDGGSWVEDWERMPVSKLLTVLCRLRGDWAHFDLTRQIDRCNLWTGFFGDFADLLRRDRFAWDTAAAEIKIPCDGEPVALPRALLIVWHLRPDLQQAFPLHEAAGQSGLYRWGKEHGRREFDFLRLIAGEEAPAAEVTEGEGARAAADRAFGRTERGGVNVVGFAAGELGIGEDVRMAIRSLTEAGVPAIAYNAPLHLQSRARDARVAGYLRDEPVYDTNFFALPGMETLRLYATHGSGLFQGRVNIGLWPWELPRWPEELIPALSLMQEMWANSRYIQETMARVCPCPVIHMPLAVEIPDVPQSDRSEFGLPADRYLFLFVFDGLSWPSRKNPLGTIRAFQSAFGTRKDVGLVVKAMNLDARYPQVGEFLELATVDDRVIHIDATLDRDKLLRLFQCCDAYVSLHRAEGFGRTIAEAMLLGKPCIVTNFSGNTDFCREDTAFLVDGPLVPLHEADYFYTKDQYWCDPDIGEAACQMRQCFENRAEARSRGDNARRLILAQHSPRVVGERYRARLVRLGLL